VLLSICFGDSARTRRARRQRSAAANQRECLRDEGEQSAVSPHLKVSSAAGLRKYNDEAAKSNCREMDVQRMANEENQDRAVWKK
jgi:hypothetical protein